MTETEFPFKSYKISKLESKCLHIISRVFHFLVHFVLQLLAENNQS